MYALVMLRESIIARCTSSDHVGNPGILYTVWVSVAKLETCLSVHSSSLVYNAGGCTWILLWRTGIVSFFKWKTIVLWV